MFITHGPTPDILNCCLSFNSLSIYISEAVTCIGEVYYSTYAYRHASHPGVVAHFITIHYTTSPFLNYYSATTFKQVLTKSLDR